MEDSDRLVGLHADTGNEVFQDGATGLLYYLGPPRKQYVSLHSVNLGSANPAEVSKTKEAKPAKKTKKKKPKKTHLELIHSTPS